MAGMLKSLPEPVSVLPPEVVVPKIAPAMPLFEESTAHVSPFAIIAIPSVRPVDDFPFQNPCAVVTAPCAVEEGPAPPPLPQAANNRTGTTVTQFIFMILSAGS